MIQGEHQSAGPRSVRPATAYRLSPTRERVLGLLAQAPEPVTIAEVAAQLGGHANSARAHLDGLTAQGLVDRETQRTQARGRPRYQYAITASGRAAHYSLEHADERALEYHGLLRAFVSHLDAYRERPGSVARDVGRLWGKTLAQTSDRPPRDQVLDLLTHLGFSPVEQVAGGLVELRSCPLLDLAGEHPDVICNVHVGMVQGLLSAAGGDPDGVALRAFAAPGACHLALPD